VEGGGCVVCVGAEAIGSGGVTKKAGRVHGSGVTDSLGMLGTNAMGLVFGSTLFVCTHGDTV
jgi:hypothetical protein